MYLSLFESTTNLGADTHCIYDRMENLPQNSSLKEAILVIRYNKARVGNIYLFYTTLAQ